MIGWYQCYFFTVLVLLIFGSQRDRMALWIVLLAAIGSELLKYGFPIPVSKAWQLVVFNGVVESLTLFALLRWARNRSGYMQAACVAVALAAHLLEFAIVKLAINFPQDWYWTAIKLIAALQLVLFYDTIRLNLRRIGGYLESLRPLRLGGLRAGGVHSGLLHDPHPSRLQTLPGSRQAN
jgi:hypothetical protein